MHGRAASMLAVAGAPLLGWLLPALLPLPPQLILLLRPPLLLFLRCSQAAPPSVAPLRGGKRVPWGAALAAV
jgi:hypothetical protein